VTVTGTGNGRGRRRRRRPPRLRPVRLLRRPAAFRGTAGGGASGRSSGAAEAAAGRAEAEAAARIIDGTKRRPWRRSTWERMVPPRIWGAGGGGRRRRRTAPPPRGMRREVLGAGIPSAGKGDPIDPWGTFRPWPFPTGRLTTTTTTTARWDLPWTLRGWTDAPATLAPWRRPVRRGGGHRRRRFLEPVDQSFARELAANRPRGGT